MFKKILDKSLLLILLIFKCLNSFSQSGFSDENVIRHKMEYINLTIEADLNGDGFDDLLTVYNENTISWHQNHIEDGFGGPNIITNIPNNITALFAADIDNDGDLDIVSASRFDDRIAWYKNDGLGNFGELINVSLDADLAQSVFVSDLDGDGDLDIISASYHDDKIAWYENDGFGDFSSEIIISLYIDGANFVNASDLDNDGDMDIIATGYFHTEVVWFENDSSGNFVFEHNITNVPVGEKFLHLENIDNDLDNDLILGTILDSVYYVKNDGSGNFDSKEIIASLSSNLKDIISSDFDNDGFLDLLIATTNKLSWFKYDTNYTYIEKSIINNNFNDATILDYNNDTRIDIVTNSNNRIVLFKNEVNNIFNSQKIVYEYQDNPYSIAMADLDYDNDLDIIAAYEESNKLVWYKNDGNGNFSGQHVISDVAKGRKNIFIADINNDLIDDIIITSSNSSTNKVTWFINDGFGNFNYTNDIFDATSGSPYFVHADYINSDNRKDILVLKSNPEWYSNFGSGNFNSGQDISLGTDDATFVMTYDIDEDLDKDIIVLSNSSASSQNNIKWLENEGNGSFSIPKLITNLVDSPYEVVFADIDNDGLEDLISVDYYSVSWFKSDGLSNFGSRNIITNDIDRGSSVKVSDFNGDGFLDVVSASSFDNKIAWYQNDGLGVFFNEQIISNNVLWATEVLVGDIDNDGDDDVVSMSYGDRKIAWYENQLNNATLSGITFYDENNNGIKDSLEHNLSIFKTKIIPSNSSEYVNLDGEFEYYLTPGNYDITYDSIDNWVLNTDTNVFNIDVISSSQYQNYNFGFIPTDTITDLRLNISSKFPRCDQFVEFEVSLRNLGTSIINDGTIFLKIDSLISDTMFVNTPDTIVNSYNYGWDFTSLYPGELIQKNLKLKLPSISSSFPLGSNLSFSSELVYPSLDSFDSVSFNYNPLIFCSYDPNDKSVIPYRDGPDNFVLFNETLQYTIRFQNTGNDTAFNVIIIDTLNSNLDFNSFQFLSSSHLNNLKINFSNDSIVSFEFRNINLPDSTTSYSNSQGFLIFSISLNDSLPNLSKINNSASIYFDNNSPIITNTTQNTVVYELIETLLTPSSLSWIIFPNPSKDSFKIEFSDYTKINKIEIFDSNGQSYYSSSVLSFRQIIETQSWPKGIYFISVISIGGKKVRGNKLIIN